MFYKQVFERSGGKDREKEITPPGRLAIEEIDFNL